MAEEHPVRRVRGIHDIRFDGLSDLLLRAHGASVLDVGCNRGHIGYEFAVNGARLIHGFDVHAPSIHVARGWFAELDVISKFEVVDLTRGSAEITKHFGPEGYDIVLFIGVQHKLKRVMQPEALAELIEHLGRRAIKYLAWNGYADDFDAMDKILAPAKVFCVHTSEMTMQGRLAAVWKR